MFKSRSPAFRQEMPGFHSDPSPSDWHTTAGSEAKEPPRGVAMEAIGSFRWFTDETYKTKHCVFFCFLIANSEISGMQHHPLKKTLAIISVLGGFNLSGRFGRNMISRYVDVSYINWVILSTETSQLPKLVSWTHAEKPKCHSKKSGFNCNWSVSASWQTISSMKPKAKYS